MRIGLLGGGQLGRMFLQVAANYPYTVKVLDPQVNAPCAHLCDEFVVGDFADAETVTVFGADCDVVGIEIEHVSVEGLRRLEKQGVRVVPSPDVLEIIQDKGLQKQFYQQHGIATAPFSLAETAADIQIAPPFVQKTRKGGYDGKGVQVIRQSDDMSSLWDVPSVIETLCPIEKEIAAIVAVDANGQQKLYPLVEMVFDEALNLVDVVQMPVQLSDEIIAEAERLALKVATAFGKEGLYAVEMFVTQSGEVWVNETACRVHNSGHLTIEACVCSQFEQMWRILAQQPLGETTALSSAAMLNLVGGKRQQGEARLSHLDDLLRQPRVYVHWYGKNEVRPGRKMGHVTLTAEQSTALPTMIQSIKPFLSVEAKS